MPRHRWCSFCTHSFDEGRLAEDDFGLPACPYCGAPGMYLRAWNAVRSLFPDLPEEPVDGERYRLGDGCVEDEPDPFIATTAQEAECRTSTPL